MQLTLLHGWAMHSGIWDPLIPALQPHASIKALDLPGHGHNPDTPDDYNLASVADTLQAVLPKQSVVVGWSMGGMVAIELALQQPQKVQALILINSTPRFANTDDWDKGVPPAVLEGFATELESGVERTLARFLSLQLGKLASAEQLRQLRQLVKSRPAPDIAVMRKGLNILATADLRSRVAQLNLPVLIVQGQRDRLTPAAAAHWLAEQIPDAGKHVIAGAGHAPFLSHTDEVASAMIEFLQSINIKEQ
ncbi:MAG: pimeloyl-ACP methyl ester esterase BioH [Proteobacteria bacterium]|nr:pimeloyl-ACP methyl ester esterase BioH [Pseudomonadota bacterium]